MIPKSVSASGIIQVLKHQLRRFQLRQVADAGQGRERALADEAVQGLAARQRYPRIILAPQDFDRTADIAEQRFNLLSKACYPVRALKPNFASNRRSPCALKSTTREPSTRDAQPRS